MREREKAPGGGGTPLYKPYMYVPSLRVGFLRRFSLKTGIDFPYHWSGGVMVFEGTTGVYESIHRFNSSEVERKRNMRIRNCFLRNLFCSRSNLSNDEIK